MGQRREDTSPGREENAITSSQGRPLLIARCWELPGPSLAPESPETSLATLDLEMVSLWTPLGHSGWRFTGTPQKAQGGVGRGGALPSLGPPAAGGLGKGPHALGLCALTASS